MTAVTGMRSRMMMSCRHTPNKAWRHTTTMMMHFPRMMFRNERLSNGFLHLVNSKDEELSRMIRSISGWRDILWYFARLPRLTSYSFKEEHMCTARQYSLATSRA